MRSQYSRLKWKSHTESQRVGGGECVSRMITNTASNSHKVIELEQVQENFHLDLSAGWQRYWQADRLGVEPKPQAVSLSWGQEDRDHPHGVEQVGVEDLSRGLSSLWMPKTSKEELSWIG